MLGVPDVDERHDRGKDTKRDIDVENPRPVVVVDDPAAQCRTNRRANHDADTEHRLADADLLRWERLEESRLRRGEQRAAANPLDDAPENEEA